MGSDLMEKIMNYGMELDTWYAFWDELEGKHSLNTPEFSRKLISWVHRFTIDKPFTRFIATKLYNNKKDGVNDRLAIGIKPNPMSNIAFALFPMKGNKDPLKKGELLFIFYALRAQSEDEPKSEEALVGWLEENKVSANLAKFIYPVGGGIQYDGKLDQTFSYNHYAQSVVKGFNEEKIMLLNKETKRIEAVNLLDMESLFTAMIQHKIVRDRR